MTRSETAGSSSGRWTVTRQVLQFVVAGLIAVTIVGIATQIASRRIGQREAITDARSTTLSRAQAVVEPAITDGLLSAQPAAVARVDRVVEARVLDNQLVRVKIWTHSGRIVYSDEPRLIGTTYPLADDELEALDKGVIAAEVSDLTRPENRFERDQGKLLEVYLPIRAPSGQRLLFEAYYRYDAVAASGRRIWRSFAPLTIGALVALELVQVPIAWSLARRLRHRQQERERLLQQAVDASDAERRRIASDLHDGVVQDLAGVAYSLAGSARRKAAAPTAALLEESAAQVRDSITSLRTLLIDIYPPKLADAGLASALADLVTSASARGLDASIHVDDLDPVVPVAAAALAYRAAQEAVRNTLAHARASSVSVTAASRDGHLVLDVVDDGVGFEQATALARQAQGHVGLRGLHDLVTAAEGKLDVRSAPGAGTTLHLEVPTG